MHRIREAAVEIRVVEFLDLSLKRILTRPLDSRGRINVGSHVEIVRATPKTGFENRMIGLTGARITGDFHFVFLNKGGQALGIHRVNLNDDKAVARHSGQSCSAKTGSRSASTIRSKHSNSCSFCPITDPTPPIPMTIAFAIK